MEGGTATAHGEHSRVRVIVGAVGAAAPTLFSERLFYIKRNPRIFRNFDANDGFRFSATTTFILLRDPCTVGRDEGA